MTEANPTPVPPPNRPSPILILFLVFPILGIIAALGFALSEQGATSGALPTPLPVTLDVNAGSLIGQPAPNFELTGLDGTSFRLSSTRGRVVFLNFWATWCEPCKRELPAFQQFTAEQGDSGALILAVNVAEPKDVIEKYFADNGLGGLNVLLDTDLETYTAYDVQVMPTTFVIDPGGVVRYKHLGELKMKDLNAYLNEMKATG